MTTASRAQPTEPTSQAGPVAGVHQKTLERVYGRIFAAYAILIVLLFWQTARALSGQRTGSVVAGLLLSVLVVWQALLAFRRPPSQRDLRLLAAGTSILVLAIRLFAEPGSPFLSQDAYEMVSPAAYAWAVWSSRLVWPVPILLIVVATGAWHPDGDLPVEQSLTALSITIFAALAARLLRMGARHADFDAERLSRQLASQDAALAAEEAQRRVANAVHDDVLSVLRAVALDNLQVPWGVIVSKGHAALAALARQAPAGRRGFGSLESALRREAMAWAAELAVSCHIDDDLDVAAATVEVLSGAVGEALRNVAAHAGVHEAAVTARGDGTGGIEVTISDSGGGFDPAHVVPGSSGLRNSVRRRLEDAAGSAEITSAPGHGTTVVLRWRPPESRTAEPVDPFGWARRLAPTAWSAFLAFMLPVLLNGLVLLCIRWQDMRWKGVEIGVLIALAGLAWVCARCLAQVRMSDLETAVLMAAVTVLAAAASLGVAPGTRDAFSYWASGGTGIVVAVVYFVRGPVLGLGTLALNVAALAVGLHATGRDIPAGGLLLALTSPAIGAGLAVGFRAAVRGLASYTERQLADYSKRLRRQARAEAMSRVDSAALENARAIAGPVLSAVISGRHPDAELRLAAALANASLRDELLAPGFLTPSLAERVHAARVAGARITIDVPGQEEAGLVEASRELLGAALDDAEEACDITLQVFPPGGGHSAVVLLRAHHPGSDQGGLRERARDHGALLSELDDHELLLQFEPAAGLPPD